MPFGYDTDRSENISPVLKTDVKEKIVDSWHRVHFHVGADVLNASAAYGVRLSVASDNFARAYLNGGTANLLAGDAPVSSSGHVS